MKRLGYLLVLVLFSGGAAAAEDCHLYLQEMKLPKKLKTRGKPKVLKWEEVDKVLNELDKKLQGSTCTFRFDQLFTTKEETPYFPLTNSVIRLVPEATLEKLKVFTREGDELGTYAGRVRYERSGGLYARDSYSLFYFQYDDPSGETHAVGSRLLLDEFTVPWTDLKGQAAIAAN